jgi:hypothetical protein
LIVSYIRRIIKGGKREGARQTLNFTTIEDSPVRVKITSLPFPLSVYRERARHMLMAKYYGCTLIGNRETKNPGKREGARQTLNFTTIEDSPGPFIFGTLSSWGTT